MLEVVVGVAVVVVAAGVTGGFALIVRMYRDQRQMHEDWRGEPARPGVPERPGVMVRLERIESAQLELRATQGDQGRQIEEIWHEVHPNSGSSLADRVGQVHAVVVPAPEREQGQ